ncbi:MAG: hypothetical protein EXS31_08445 [Pedosphaera sp.]|nr:hypothetical protein [Pedosphaera sp.]
MSRKISALMNIGEWRDEIVFVACSQPDESTKSRFMQIGNADRVRSGELLRAQFQVAPKVADPAGDEVQTFLAADEGTPLELDQVISAQGGRRNF